MRLPTALPRATHLALTALALLSATGAALADPPPYTHVVENARVTREVVYDHPVYRHHRICVEGPLPAEGFDARYIDIHLHRPAPSQLDMLLKPVVEPNGRVCAIVSGAVAVEPELTIEIRDMRQFYDQYLYYEGPMLAIPAKTAPR